MKNIIQQLQFTFTRFDTVFLLLAAILVLIGLFFAHGIMVWIAYIWLFLAVLLLALRIITDRKKMNNGKR